MSTNTSKFTTIAELFEQAILQNGDNLKEVITDTFTELLDEKFENGHGSDVKNSKYADVNCWSNNYVYISIIFDGKIEIISAPRNPPQ